MFLAWNHTSLWSMTNSVRMIQQFQQGSKWEEGYTDMGGSWEEESPTCDQKSGGKAVIP